MQEEIAEKKKNPEAKPDNPPRKPPPPTDNTNSQRGNAEGKLAADGPPIIYTTVAPSLKLPPTITVKTEGGQANSTSLKLDGAITVKMEGDKDHPEPTIKIKTVDEGKSIFDNEASAGLITAIVTAILGALFALFFQKRKHQQELDSQKEASYDEEEAKKNDEDRSQREAALKEEQSVVASALEIVGVALAAVEDLVSIVSATHRPHQLGPTESLPDLYKSFLSGNQQWRKKRTVIGSLMILQHPQSPDVPTAWRALDDAVQAYIDKAISIYNARTETTAPSPHGLGHGFQESHARVIERLDDFTRRIASARAETAKPPVTAGAGMQTQLEDA